MCCVENRLFVKFVEVLGLNTKWIHKTRMKDYRGRQYSPPKVFSRPTSFSAISLTTWNVLCGYFLPVNIVKIMQNTCRFSKVSVLVGGDCFTRKRHRTNILASFILFLCFLSKWICLAFGTDDHDLRGHFRF